MKRGYLVFVSDEEYVVAVVATSSKEAKKLAIKNDIYDLFCDCDFTEIKVKWQKEGKVEDLPIGVVEDAIKALERNIYGYIDGFDCPVCGNETILSNINGKVMCSECEDKLEDKTEP